MSMVRVLLIADTHLGFDLPSRPRVDRRRRGPDFFANTRLALEPALRGEVGLVVHGGDLLFRGKVPAGLVMEALEPLLEVADAGVPVVLVPGNHERSALPYPLLASHRRLHIFDRPRTIELEVANTRVALGGFPCQRDGVCGRFSALVEATGALAVNADVRLLCLHQTVEGARVKGFTFRRGGDVVRGREIPSGFAAVLCGHIHRTQILTRDLAGRALRSPVLYPGSVERTSFAERDEPKGYLLLEIEPDWTSGGQLADWRFHQLPTRPMEMVTVDATGLAPEDFERALRDEFERLPIDAVVQLQVEGNLGRESGEVIRAARLRRLHPSSMTVELRFRAPWG
jgi:exonuclease SbcD